MKKILFLTLLSLFAGCASQQQVKASVADPPPARMNFTLMNLVNNQLNPDSVIGSSVSISSDLVLEKLELHSINANGVHIFTKQKITILAGSLGMFLSRPEGGTIIQRATPIFPLRTRDSLRRNFEFEFDSSSPIHFE